jgi:hypothetical protein
METGQLLILMGAVMILQGIVIAFQRWRIRELGMELTDCRNQYRRCSETCRKLRAKSSLSSLLLVCLIGSTAMAQSEPAHRTDKDSTQTVGSIVTNGQLQNRDFTLLLIHAGDQLSGQFLGMLSQPKSAQLKQWTDALYVRPMHANEPFIRDHHSDLLQKHQGQFPIVAIVDTSGGVWWSEAGSRIPSTELTLAKELSDAYAATLRAARDSGRLGGNSNTAQRADWNAYQPFNPPMNVGPSQSRFLARGVGAPDPVVIPAVNMTTTGPNGPPVVAAGSGDETLILIGAMCVVCSLILAGGVVAGSTIVASAITDDEAAAAE